MKRVIVYVCWVFDIVFVFYVNLLLPSKGSFDGSVTTTNLIEGTDPGFSSLNNQEFVLKSSSECRGEAGSLHSKAKSVTQEVQLRCIFHSLISASTRSM